MPAVRYSQEGRVVTLTLANPPYNLVTREMTEQLDAALVHIERDPSVGAVILASDLDGIFLSHDVQEILQMGEALKLQLPGPIIRAALSVEYYLNYIPGVRRALKPTMLGGLSALNLYHSVTRRIRSSSKVYIAAINGRAMGGGCELSLACDFRIMVDGKLEDGVSVIGQPECVLGLIPGGGGTQMLARTVGRAKALEICLEGRPMNAADALKLGLVTQTVKLPAKLREASTRLAQRMARRNSTSIKAIKDAIHLGGSAPLEQGLLLEMSGFAATAGLPECQSAMARYVERVDEVLGPTATIDRLLPWLDGKELSILAKS